MIGRGNKVENTQADMVNHASQIIRNFSIHTDSPVSIRLNNFTNLTPT